MLNRKQRIISKRQNVQSTIDDVNEKYKQFLTAKNETDVVDNSNPNPNPNPEPELESKIEIESELEFEIEIKTEPTKPATAAKEEAKNTHEYVCSRCNNGMVVLVHESRLGCTTCGLTSEYLQATSSRIAYGEEVEFSVFSYKRHNHFLDWLAAFQAKESTIIREDVIVKVMAVLYQRGVALEEITCSIVKDVLRELKLSKCYDNTSQITARITGKLPPRMTPFQEQQVKLMFQAIQEPFRQHCPAGRRNFLSYSYVLYKFCEIMGWDVFLQCFTLLKGKDKLKVQDEIFEKICKTLKWQYPPAKEDV